MIYLSCPQTKKQRGLGRVFKEAKKKRPPRPIYGAGKTAFKYIRASMLKSAGAPSCMITNFGERVGTHPATILPATASENPCRQVLSNSDKLRDFVGGLRYTPKNQSELSALLKTEIGLMNYRCPLKVCNHPCASVAACSYIFRDDWSGHSTP